MKMVSHFTHFTFIQLPAHYNCVLSHYPLVAFVYCGADCENLAALRRPHPLTRIDLLYSYRTDPVNHTYLGWSL